MDIPYTELSDDALRAIIEEYVTREGTEYGAVAYSLESKVEQVKRQLQVGEVRINYDAENQTCNLVRADQGS